MCFLTNCMLSNMFQVEWSPWPGTIRGMSPLGALDLPLNPSADLPMHLPGLLPEGLFQSKWVILLMMAIDVVLVSRLLEMVFLLVQMHQHLTLCPSRLIHEGPSTQPHMVRAHTHTLSLHICHKVSLHAFHL